MVVALNPENMRAEDQPQAFDQLRLEFPEFGPAVLRRNAKACVRSSKTLVFARHRKANSDYRAG